MGKGSLPQGQLEGVTMRTSQAWFLLAGLLLARQGMMVKVHGPRENVIPPYVHNYDDFDDDDFPPSGRMLQLDANGDGKLTLEEFITEENKKHDDHEEWKAQMAKWIKDHDTDGDDAVNDRELD